MATRVAAARSGGTVSVLFNEPKLLKLGIRSPSRVAAKGFSALQRAEIAEIDVGGWRALPAS